MVRNLSEQSILFLLHPPLSKYIVMVELSHSLANSTTNSRTGRKKKGCLPRIDQVLPFGQGETRTDGQNGRKDNAQGKEGGWVDHLRINAINPLFFVALSFVLF